MRKSLAALCFGAVLGWPAIAAAVQFVRWDGNTDGDGDNVNYSDPLNWNLDSVVPLNSASEAYNVEVPDMSALSTATVNYSGLGSGQIEGLTLHGGSQIDLFDGSLTVTDNATIDGTIFGQGGNFTSTTSSLTTAALGSAARLWAQNGSTVAVDATTYSGEGLSTDSTFVQAIGANSVVDLSGLTQITVPDDNFDHLDIRASNGGTILLDELATIDISFRQRGVSRFFIEDGSALTLPSLRELRRTDFHVTGGGVLSDEGSGPWTFSRFIFGNRTA